MTIQDTCWSDEDLVKHFEQIRVEDEADGPVVDGIGADWISFHFERLAELLRAGYIAQQQETPRSRQVIGTSSTV